MFPTRTRAMLFLGWILTGILASGTAGLWIGIGRAQEHKMGPPEPAHGQMSTDSIYNLDSSWSDQDGQRVAIRTLRGKPRVVAGIYTKCKYECPLIVDEMKHVERALSADERARVGLALFSFDPERDSVGVLKAYAAERSLDESRWRLYTGTADDVLDLAAVLGMRIRKEPNGDFSHSTIITVLDREGVIRYQMLGLGQDRAPLLAALRAALKS
jgi:protein SCO1